MALQSLEPEFCDRRKYQLSSRKRECEHSVKDDRDCKTIVSLNPALNTPAIRESKRQRRGERSSTVVHTVDSISVLGLLSAMESVSAHQADGYLQHNVEGFTWWLSRVMQLPTVRTNGWVVARMLEEYLHEEKIASVCQLERFSERMSQAGLSSLLDTCTPPRKRCAELKKAERGVQVDSLLDEPA